MRPATPEAAAVPGVANTVDAVLNPMSAGTAAAYRSASRRGNRVRFAHPQSSCTAGTLPLFDAVSGGTHHLTGVNSLGKSQRVALTRRASRRAQVQRLDVRIRHFCSSRGVRAGQPLVQVVQNAALVGVQHLEDRGGDVWVTSAAGALIELPQRGGAMALCDVAGESPCPVVGQRRCCSQGLEVGVRGRGPFAASGPADAAGRGGRRALSVELDVSARAAARSANRT